MNCASLVAELRKYTSSNVFNPYADLCEKFDLENANEIRSQNLTQVLENFSHSQVDSIWIGRDLGHRGGRRTGLALTDEANLVSASQVWRVELTQATKGDILVERTAANIWRVMKSIDENIFMWNVFPFHPHENGRPFTNRSHTARERETGMEFLRELITLLKPGKLVAIGNDAFQSAVRIYPKNVVHKIRHPSYGGERQFTFQIKELYRTDSRL